MAAFDEENLIYSQQGAVARILLNRPGKLNTVTSAMGKELMRLAENINDDETVRVVILSGVGDRAFSAGSDIRALDDYGSNWQLRNRKDYNRAIWSIRKPVIAAIRGYAIGGGLELALNSDIRIASQTARLGAGEVKLGWVAGAGNTQLLPRLVGYGKALQLLMTGDLIEAEEAHRLGLVQEVVEDGNLEAFSFDLAERIARNPPIAVQLIKHLVRVAESTSLQVGFDYENDLFSYCFTTGDHEEGIAAFREKRAPVFEGR
ncbi:MAG: enoyl-CoA hydratase/isomerase family protein [Verrucomicrobia bacterium]|nr:enoyl-CoA hydratase/isomerase family protein [Verrucomicrobiota bacterium]